MLRWIKKKTVKRKKDMNKSREGGLEIHWLQGSKAGKSEGGSWEGARDEIEGKQKGKLSRDEVWSQQSS